jgi:flavin-dependent dehydrogenase
MLPRDSVEHENAGLSGPTELQNNGQAQKYDVIIVGGGAAGIGAAIGAKQVAAASRVLIVESEGCLGGAGTHRGVNSYAGLYSVGPKPRRVVGKIWDEIHSRLVKLRAAGSEPDQIVTLVQVSAATRHNWF